MVINRHTTTKHPCFYVLRFLENIFLSLVLRYYSEQYNICYYDPCIAFNNVRPPMKTKVSRIANFYAKIHYIVQIRLGRLYIELEFEKTFISNVGDATLLLNFDRYLFFQHNFRPSVSFSTQQDDGTIGT
jgi:hypothetical protein